jgi:hypothetical protein
MRNNSARFSAVVCGSISISWPRIGSIPISGGQSSRMSSDRSRCPPANLSHIAKHPCLLHDNFSIHFYQAIGICLSGSRSFRRKRMTCLCSSVSSGVTFSRYTLKISDLFRPRVSQDRRPPEQFSHQCFPGGKKILIFVSVNPQINFSIGLGARLRNAGQSRKCTKNQSSCTSPGRDWRLLRSMTIV